MDKQMLRCDICGGTLKMQANREAVCESCGMAYSVESLKEKFNGLKVSVTGSSDDVEQWKTLVNTYLQQHDFIAAERIVKKILEAAPLDEFANNLYLLLQDWKYLEIVNGSLIRYSGRANDVILPEGIQIVGESAFKDSKVHGVSLPNSLLSIEDGAFEGCINLADFVLPQRVKRIGNYAFKGCSSIRSIDLSNVEICGNGCFSECESLSQAVLPNGITSISNYMFLRTALVEITIPPKVKTIGQNAFEDCFSLKKIHLPNGIEKIDWHAFSFCRALEQLTIPSTVKEIGSGAFGGCSKLTRIDIPQALKNEIYHEYCKRDREFSYDGPLSGTPWWDKYIEQKEMEERRFRNVCQYCGGEFKGLFNKVCSKCGKTKDY